MKKPTKRQRAPSKSKSVGRRSSGYCHICGKTYDASHLSHHTVERQHFATVEVLEMDVCPADVEQILLGARPGLRILHIQIPTGK